MSNLRLTERDILNSMLNGTITPEVMKEYAQKKLAQLDRRNDSARKRTAKRRASADPLTDAIFDALSDIEPMSREDLFEVLHDSWPELTVGKISYRLSALVRERPDEVIRQEATTLDANGRMKKVVIYTRQFI